MLVSALISLAQRSAGVLGVGQTALPQDLADAQSLLLLLMQQWRQKRWLVFRLDDVLFPLSVGKASYTVGPASPPGITPAPAAPDVVVAGNYRPANVQSCYLRQNTGSGPNSFPLDFPIRVLRSRQEFDAISLKSLQSWPSLIYFDPKVPYAQLNIWPVPMQNLFSLHIGFQQAIDLAAEGAQSVDLDSLLPSESQLALMWNLGLQLAVAYKLPPDQQLAGEARASLNTLRMTNFALRPLLMPAALRRQVRLTNPMAGFYPEVAAGVPFSVLT